MREGTVAMPTFAWPVRDYYEDTDPTGTACRAAALAFRERAQTEWLRAAGANLERLRVEDDVAFTVACLEAAYLAPARLGDDLQISVEAEKCGRASFRLDPGVERVGETLCRAVVR